MDYDFDNDLSINPTLGSITELIGKSLAAKISMDFGGRRLYITKNMGENSPLAVSVGLDAAKKIANIYGGQEFTVPISLGKEAEVRKLCKEGLSASTIARRVRCCLSYVYRVRSEMTQENQTSLF
ncbi:MAG: hypothetical protein CMP22_07200 [Rickettsiales bacterium]|nr:hypothetical protein [Rickettsiales bacterium]